MIRRKALSNNVIIDLDGTDGNAHHLEGLAIAFARDMRMDDQNIKSIIREMRNGDYKHLVLTFDKYFGSHVMLDTTNEELLS